MTNNTEHKTIDKKTVNRILSKIKSDEPIRVALPAKGLINMERPVPFMVVYRIPPNGKDGFTSRLGKTESSYLHAQDSSETTEIIKSVANELADRFKGFLLLEVWLAEEDSASPFTIHVGQKSGVEVAEKLKTELSKINILGDFLKAEINKGKNVVAPHYYKPLIDAKEANKSSITLISILN